jgi:hypothetical protein
MKKHVTPLVAILLFCINSFSLTAQENKVVDTDRFIEINDINNFFALDGSKDVVVCSFELFNILEAESSKPIFVAVNELSGVVDFSIKSGSERFENQRSCVLKLNTADHISTFRLVLDRMDVKFILSNGNKISVNDFFSKSL